MASCLVPWELMDPLQDVFINKFTRIFTCGRFIFDIINRIPKKNYDAINAGDFSNFDSLHQKRTPIRPAASFLKQGMSANFRLINKAYI